MTRAIAASRTLAGITAMLCSSPLFGVELAGQVNIEHRQFFTDGAQGQDKGQTSLVLQPEFYWELQDGDASFTFTPFYRWDSMDDERTHGDIREALY